MDTNTESTFSRIARKCEEAKRQIDEKRDFMREWHAKKNVGGAREQHMPYYNMGPKVSRKPGSGH